MSTPSLSAKAVTYLVRTIFVARRDRLTNPEGTFDGAGRWYPSDTENASGSGRCVRSPSRAWPYSYMLRCRTRQHCRALVEQALLGCDVPDDVARALKAALAGEQVAA